jgi:3-oxoacyl-[acyl-carrier-protein] synthase-3
MAAELDRRLGLAEGSTLATNGIERRAFASREETVGRLAVAAMAAALDAASLNVRDLDALLFASVMSEQPMPATSVAILDRLGGGAGPATCYDINASCLGFLRAFESAADGIAVGRWRRVGVVAADIASQGLDWSDPGTATLFGDGAGAMVLAAAEEGEDSRILGSCSLTIPEGFDLCQLKAGGSRYNIHAPPQAPGDRFFRMDGPGLLRLSLSRFPGFLDRCLALGGGRVDVVVPHQASQTGLKLLTRLLAARGPTDVVDVLADHGNQVSASLPTALDIAIRAGRIMRGKTVLLIGTSAGVAMGGLVLRY